MVAPSVLKIDVTAREVAVPGVGRMVHVGVTAEIRLDAGPPTGHLVHAPYRSYVAGTLAAAVC